MKTVIRIARKEFAGFFSSPAAFIFFGAFLAVTLFVFFWVETFFARNIADVRPLFEWMPVLLIFLAAAITMRMWSEERRAGTLEFLLTAPVPPRRLVMGKFLACVALVAVALALTIPLPVTVSLLGRLDWGPVFGGYLATLVLAAAYIAMGLFVSAASANQIVSLIAASLLGGGFYALSSDVMTALFGGGIGEILKLLGTGARFESIARGIVDVRDLFYYASLVGAFLSLNVYVLERQRWAGNASNSHHRRWALATVLLAANFLGANLWLSQVDSARADVTEGRIYSISESTRVYLAQLREPLLIRGYFSAKTHPLLAPLVPRIRDLLEEYAVAGEGKVRVEFIDPLQNSALEQEAGEKYGIRPVPFQFASKYESSVVNSYFDILVRYGDQHEVLGFRDLIEVKVEGANDIEVELRNPEYDITRAVKKVLYSYQGTGELFENIPHPVLFKGYISPAEKLPPPLVDLKEDLDSILGEYESSSQGKLAVQFNDPDASGGALGRRLTTDYGFRPMSAGLFSGDTFWFYMTLEGDGRLIQIPLPAELDRAGLERSFESGLKRFSRGFLKTVALHTPSPPAPAYGMPPMGPSFALLRDKLAEEYNLLSADLESGQVPEETDILLLAAPKDLSEKQLFAVDQFLMRGGTVVIASSPFDIGLQGSLSARRHESGLREWLAHNGITLEESMVLDPQSAAFPIPVQRRLGGFVVQETRLVDYPYFADIREDGLGDREGLTAGIDQVTFPWPSPISLDDEKNKERKVTRLLESSPQSWTSEDLNIQPQFGRFGAAGFAAGENTGRRTLAAAVEGRFGSFFLDKPSPLTEEEVKVGGSGAATPAASGEVDGEKKAVIARVIDRSPESARIILFASNSFLTDRSLDLATVGMGTRYLNPVQLVKNAVDWSLEDRGLLAIRGRTHYSRTLPPLERDAQIFWEYLNYGLALLGLTVVWLLRHLSVSRARTRHRTVLSGGGAS